MSINTISKTREGTTIIDNGHGGLVVNGREIAGGRINYQTGEIYIPKDPLRDNIHSPTFDEFEPVDRAPHYSAIAGGKVVNKLNVDVQASNRANVSYISSPDTRQIDDTIGNGQYVFDVLETIPKPCVALLDCWAFELSGEYTLERGGVLYQQWDILKGTGKSVGYMDRNGKVTINNITPNVAPTIKVLRGIYLNTEIKIKNVFGHTPAAPVKPQSLTVYADLDGGRTLVGHSGADGSITGDIAGHIDYDTGFYALNAPENLPPESIRINSVSQSHIPLDSSVIGINAVRLPADGRIPIFRRGDMVVIHNAIKQELGSAHTAGQTVKLNRQNCERICVFDAADAPINAEKYSVDLESGTLKWASPLDLSEYTMPLFAKMFWEENNRLSNTDISGKLKLQIPLKRDYPLQDTYVSSAVIGGDLQVRVTEPFSQRTWTQKWLDVAEGDPLLAGLNVKDYPIVLTDDGAITERWLIKFTSSTQFELYGEQLKLVAEGDTLSDLAPLNPATNKPYFTLPRLSFGGGWANGNCVRFNTYGTVLPLWVLRAVQPSPNIQTEPDGVNICLRGNTNVL